MDYHSQQCYMLFPVTLGLTIKWYAPILTGALYSCGFIPSPPMMYLLFIYVYELAPL